MSRRRREIETLSLSFLDVISCGFGALILLLVLTKVYEPLIFAHTSSDTQQQVTALELQLNSAREQRGKLDRNRIHQENDSKLELQTLSNLEDTLTSLQTEYAAVQRSSTNHTSTIERLSQARQSLSAEMQILLAEYQKSAASDLIGGIPVDSDYVIFIIDTSGSMREFAWPLVMQKVEETLAVYPSLKGVQIMNDQGQYMFSQYADQWIPDTPERRRAILKRLASWNAFSRSSPEKGITTAISTFYQPGRKISLYVFGDDFNGSSIAAVINQVDRINVQNTSGERLVRIHGVGFPVIFSQAAQFQASGFRFAHFMRILCERNGGTFVGLNSFRTAASWRAPD